MFDFTLEEHHCRGRRKVEEYSSSESQIQTTILLKNLLNFLSPLSERIFAESLLEVASETEFPTSSWKLLQDRTSLPSSERRESLSSERREREFMLLVLFGIEKTERYL